MRRRVAGTGLAVVALLLGVACSGAPKPRAGPTAGPWDARRPDLPYLLSPLEGYPLVADAAREARVSAAFGALITQGDAGAARAVADQLLADDPGFHPAVVLAAAVEFLERDPAAAVARLGPVAAELPGYVAAGLLLGRSAEAVGDLVAAFAAYRQTVHPLAAGRVAELEPRALEVVHRRLEDALRRGRLDEAEDHLARLLEWAPEDILRYRAEAQLAAALGDGPAELEALRALTGREPGDEAVLARRGELELALGDPGAGLQIFRDLAQRHPGDPWYEDRLAAAKFRWRLQSLPPRVQRLAQLPELARGDFAVLLYWLVPGVRFDRTTSARIAADVLEDPRRDEIVRVVNLGLMQVDETLHLFAPDRRLVRGEALAALIAVLARSDQRVACLERAALNPQPSRASVCQTAQRCQLIADPAECLAGSPVAGGEALELVRRALKLLGGA